MRLSLVSASQSNVEKQTNIKKKKKKQQKNSFEAFFFIPMWIRTTLRKFSFSGCLLTESSCLQNVIINGAISSTPGLAKCGIPAI